MSNINDRDKFDCRNPTFEVYVDTEVSENSYHIFPLSRIYDNVELALGLNIGDLKNKSRDSNLPVKRAIFHKIAHDHGYHRNEIAKALNVDRSSTYYYDKLIANDELFKLLYDKAKNHILITTINNQTQVNKTINPDQILIDSSNFQYLKINDKVIVYQGDIVDYTKKILKALKINHKIK